MRYADFNINAKRRSGQEKTLCPRCHDRRTNKRDKSLSINHDKAVWHCHYCGWAGGLREHAVAPVKRDYRKPTYRPQVTATTEPGHAKMLAWFAARGISAETVNRFQVELRKHYFPQTNTEEWAICFPFTRDGQVVNVKYRSKDKFFAMEKDAEPCLFNLDGVRDEEHLIFVEGECDVLALHEAGITNVVSVPNGAGTNLDVLVHDQELLDRMTRIIWAGDSDQAGRKLEAEALRRLGIDRCYRVEWPEGCKDANEVLLRLGKRVLVECIEAARPLPVEGAFEIAEFRQDIINLWENGREKGFDLGWANLAPFYSPRLGDWTVITGVPSSGKSYFAANILVNLANRYGVQHVVYPPENLPPAEYASMLMEIWLGLPFDTGPSVRMTMQQRDQAIDWLDHHFVILNPSEYERDLDSLLTKVKQFVFRRGIQGFLIDPWNELEHAVPNGMSMTHYIGQSLIKIRNFSRDYRVHTWIVAHPTKLPKNQDGTYPVPTLYDIEDSRHWYNKCDYGISLFRDKADDLKPVEVHVQKARYRWCGGLGMAQLYFDKVTGQFTELPVQHERAFSTVAGIPKF